jgi:CHAT domain-containing protein
LIVIPDKALQGVPFAALYDRERKRWLIEDRPVGIAPSLRLFVTAVDRDEELIPQKHDTVLAIGDPAFDRKRFSDLSRLPASRAEALRITRLYTDAKSLVDSEATTARFLHEVRGRSIVHIATHALPNPRLPSWSALLFAADSAGADAGILYAFQIDPQVFRGTRLVVLAGCETAVGKETKYEGTLSLARSFMTAGVPNVISTLWRIDDNASMDLLVTFHQRLRVGDDALAALRHAQLASIADADPRQRRVAAWAGFQLMGGSFPTRSF